MLSELQLTPTHGLLFGLFSSLLINRLSGYLHHASAIYPANVRQAHSDYYYWRYRNFLISFIHAFLTGIGSLIW